jgi:hypothetical protein
MDLGRRADLSVPNGSHDALGTGRWSAGPTAALVYSKGPWFNAVLAYQLMSFAGNRARGSVNQTYVEPEVSYKFESGWYVDCDQPMTFDWTADAADGWTVPIGADVDDAFNVGSHAMSFQLGAYVLAKRPDGAPPVDNPHTGNGAVSDRRLLGPAPLGTRA